jgi:hypothetical protein
MTGDMFGQVESETISSRTVDKSASEHGGHIFGELAVEIFLAI